MTLIDRAPPVVNEPRVGDRVRFDSSGALESLEERDESCPEIPASARWQPDDRCLVPHWAHPSTLRAPWLAPHASEPWLQQLHCLGPGQCQQTSSVAPSCLWPKTGESRAHARPHSMPSSTSRDES